MPELSPVYDGKIAHLGIFDFKELYRFMFEWFKEYQYILNEKKYSEKIKADGKEIEIEWLCLRKISDYFRFRIKIVTRVVRMVTVEVQQDGVKVNRDKGDMEIKFWSWIERDYENKWEQNSVTKFLRGVYDKYIIRSRIEFYEEKLKEEVDEVMSQTKSFLVLSAQ
jgi:hypothetical protein